MKSLASLSLLALAVSAPAAAQEPPPGDGPRGSSQPSAGETRYDAVGRAEQGDLIGVSAVSAGLPAGSYAEVTALDSGQTIIVAVVAGDVGAGRIATLSRDAAIALGATGDTFAVRIRKVVPTPQEVVQLRAGQGAGSRAAAPQALLAALRKKLAPEVMTQNDPPQRKLRSTPRPAPASKAAVPRPAPDARPVASARPATSGYVVQVAALSSAARAATVAKAVGGTVAAGPPVWRVRLGPFADAAAAGRAKAEAARKGYPGGQITRLP